MLGICCLLPPSSAFPNIPQADFCFGFGDVFCYLDDCAILLAGLPDFTIVPYSIFLIQQFSVQSDPCKIRSGPGIPGLQSCSHLPVSLRVEARVCAAAWSPACSHPHSPSSVDVLLLLTRFLFIVCLLLKDVNSRKAGVYSCLFRRPVRLLLPSVLLLLMSHLPLSSGAQCARARLRGDSLPLPPSHEATGGKGAYLLL